MFSLNGTLKKSGSVRQGEMKEFIGMALYYIEAYHCDLVSAGMAEQFLEKFAYKKYRDTKKWPDSIFHYRYFKLFVTIQCKILCTENFNLSIQNILAKYSKYNCSKVHACATFQNNKQFVHLRHYKIGLQVSGTCLVEAVFHQNLFPVTSADQP